MASEHYASLIAGTVSQVVSSNGTARIGSYAKQGRMRTTKFQGTAGYVTRMSGGVGGRGREHNRDVLGCSHCLAMVEKRTGQIAQPGKVLQPTDPAPILASPEPGLHG